MMDLTGQFRTGKTAGNVAAASADSSAISDRPIGIIDSGVGGLTVASAIIDLLPHEDIVYFGDTARYPYGSKSPQEVRRATTQVASHLIEEFNLKLLVLACNTASAVCLAYCEADEASEFESGRGNSADSPAIPVVGVIQPGVQALAKSPDFRNIGVIATTGTVSSGAYQRAMARAAPEVELTCLACPGFVEFVERGETESQQTMILARRLLAPLEQAKVEALLLGCTHYPFLSKVIAEVMGPDVALVSSADETAFEVSRVLRERGLAKEGLGQAAAPTRRWIVSGEDRWFKELGGEALGLPISAVEVHLLPSIS